MLRYTRYVEIYHKETNVKKCLYYRVVLNKVSKPYEDRLFSIGLWRAGQNNVCRVEESGEKWRQKFLV